MPFFKISFLVPHIPLLEIYFCVLWRLLTFLLVCKILNTCQVIDFGGGFSFESKGMPEWEICGKERREEGREMFLCFLELTSSMRVVSQIPRELVNFFHGDLKGERAGQGAALPGRPKAQSRQSLAPS